MNKPFNPIIAVIGSRQCDFETSQTAFEIGQLIAERQAILICGGVGGVMAAAAKGARQSGGITIGLLPGTDHNSANPDILIPLPTGLDYARNVLIARAAHGVIAISGGLGTLSEIAISLKMGKPVVSLKDWGLELPVIKAVNPQDAVDKLFQRLLK
jgi:uncharacterized protein (TIGR00725 family)